MTLDYLNISFNHLACHLTLRRLHDIHTQLNAYEGNNRSCSLHHVACLFLIPNSSLCLSLTTLYEVAFHNGDSNEGTRILYQPWRPA